MRKDDSRRNWVQDKTPDQLTRERLLGLIVCLGLITLVASTVQPVLAAPIAGGMMFWAALGAVVAGLFVREPVLQADHMTVWDRATLLLLGSLIAGFFTDPAAVEAAREAVQQGGEATSGSQSGTS